ncbi:MAG: hypothetical protein MJZ16_05555 [Bacteroidales bacterium]|nr:hypothetical protein [Bacteroidales bacterium]
MKKILLALAIMPFGLLSCEKNNLNDNNSSGPYYSEVTFKSEMLDTKASLGSVTSDGKGHPVTWNIGDSLWVYRMDGTSGGAFVAKEATRTSPFTKSKWAQKSDYDRFVDMATSTNGYYAFYPFNDVNKNKDKNGTYPTYYGTVDKGFVTVRLPEIQYAIPNGVDSDAIVMSGYTTTKDQTLQFCNAVSLLELSYNVPEGYSVKSIEVATTSFAAELIQPDNSLMFGKYSASDKEVKTKGEIAGNRVLYCPDARTWINDTYTTNQQYTITLKKADDSALVQSTNYYVSVWPGQKKGFKVVLKGSDNNGNAVSFTRASTKDLQFAKGRVYPLGTIDASDSSKWTSQN